MKSRKRRHLMQTAVLMTAGMGVYAPARAQAQPATPFAVAPTT